MDAHVGHSYSIRHSAGSSSSAIELSTTGLGVVDQAPDADGRTYARRRLSWSNAGGEPDSHRLSVPATREPGPSSLADTSSLSLASRRDLSVPLVSHPNASSSSLASMSLEDDDTCLTSESQPRVDHSWPNNSFVDSERSAGIASQPRRRYTAASPLTRTITSAFRRASTRVASVPGRKTYAPLQESGEDFDSNSDSTFDGTEETTQPDVGQKVASRTLSSMPLRGRTLGMLGPRNPLRLRLYKLLIHPYTEPTILVLIVLNAVALVVQASRTLLLPPSQVPITVTGYFHAWEDFVIFVLFILFTIEALGRICISGLLLDPEVPISSFSSFFKLAHLMSTRSSSNGHTDAPLSRSDTLARGFTLKRVYDNVAKPFSLSRSSHARTPSSARVPTRPSVSFTALKGQDPFTDPELPPTFLSRAMKSDVLESDPDALVSLPFRLELQTARSKIERSIPYLRQGWGRIDFLAVVGFWVSFALATAGLERGSHHIGTFRALSVLRVARLLGVTNGTATIMRSLKIARPLLANVVYFIIFAVALFSIIGVQSFKKALRRNCTLLPVLGENSTQLTQLCGGHINSTTLSPSPYLQSDGTFGENLKGFICPLGQVCQEGENPFGGVESFDTIYYAALQMVVLASANTWSTVMYQTMASEYVISSVFFIVGILVLNFWLFNLLVAVITNSFFAIRSGTKKSAFGAAPLGPVAREAEEGWSAVTSSNVGQNRPKVWWSYTRWFWVFLALTSLATQATVTADMGQTQQEVIDIAERVITIAFDIEIVVRIAVEFPAWRNFFLHANNLLDLFIAIGSSVIQIPVIHNSTVYRWLTVFQLARFYRVLLVVPRMKPLMLTVFGNMYGLANMTLFVILLNFLAALIGIQLIRGDMAGSITMNFGHLFNSFLAVYQIFSSENWTTVLYNATDAELGLGQAIIVCTFLSCWLLFSNFIVMQMFIAVINENFSVAEEAKREMQKSNYSKQHSRPAVGRWSLINPYRWFGTRPTTEYLPSPLIRSETDTLVDSPLPMDDRFSQRRAPWSASTQSHSLHQRSFSRLHELFAGGEMSENIPLVDLYRPRSDSRGPEDAVEHETDRYFDILTRLERDKNPSSRSTDAHRSQTIELIRMHPTYDKAFWILPQTNSIRRLCQKVVDPSGGERIFGAPPSDIAHAVFQLAILLAVIGNVATEAIATPLYKYNYYLQNGVIRGAWFDITKATFSLILFVEFLIKIIADGFLFGPNAYIRSIWNILDFVIMVGVVVNATFALVFVAGFSPLIRALKALQALRFMTLIHRMRSTFSDLILTGFTRILDAALLAVLYLIPFSVWGTTIFAGLMNECNDTSVQGMGDCTNEYVNTIYGNSFGFLVPRAWDNPAPSTKFSFDNFASSMLILFEIVSEEGWVDVMSVAMSITGRGQQPQTNASQANAIFFVIYNLLGGVVILTLFVSIIIENFSSQTGTALLTEAQREWIDMQKLLKRLKPSKRPKVKPSSPIRAWCYDRAIHKHGWWTRMMTALFVFQMVVLMTETFSAETVDNWRNIVSFVITLIYVLDTVIRLYGLGWRSFRANGWNLFDVVVALGSFSTTLVARFDSDSRYIQYLQKIFLVSMAFKLVQRVASLNQLFKTGTASFFVILNLLALWLTFFVFFAIMYMEVFGLTKWCSGENPYQNYQTMGSSFLMLVFMSTGEGWNQFMHDYTLGYPRCTQVYDGFFQTDCGDTLWAFSLFIAWNLLSMYIFVNMFTGVVVDSFSYVFQSTGGVLKSITRHETRAFKKAWADFADPNTGLLERSKLAPFLARLNGVFEVRIYPAQHSTASILSACRRAPRPGEAATGEVNLRKLNRLLSKIDFGAIRERRAAYMRIYYEASATCYHRGDGISFTEMLMLLAHHKLINEEALGLKELGEREETLKLVATLVALDKIRSQLRTISLSRAFRREREKARGIPTIVIGETPGTSAKVHTTAVDGARDGQSDDVVNTD